MLNIKTERALKDQAKKVAQDLGLPLSTIINCYLKNLIQERRVVFADHPTLNSETRKVLDQVLLDVKKGENLSGPFATAEEMIVALKK